MLTCFKIQGACIPLCYQIYLFSVTVAIPLSMLDSTCARVILTKLTIACRGKHFLWCTPRITPLETWAMYAI